MSFPPPGAPNNNKRAIPRLPSHPNPNRYGVTARQRVPRACYACRARKIKCNGAQPACQSCREHAIACSYAPARKDRVKQLTDSNQRLVRLLKDLRSQVSDARSKEIDQLLQDAADEANDAMAIQDGPASTHSKSPFVADDERGETGLPPELASSHEVGITVDITDEDLLESEESRATGFTGRNSEIQMMRRLHHLADNPKMDAVSGSGPYGPPGMGDQAVAARPDAARSRTSSDNSVPTRPANSHNFYMDNENVELDVIVDPSELPPYETAKKLLDSYMNTVHNSFPILDKLSLYNRFNDYYASLGSGAPQTWSERSLAVFNLVFAIGAVFSHLAESDWRGDARDYTIYQSRAWALVFKDPWWYPHPDLSQLQLAGLLSLYYLTIGHVNRSWMVSGIAIRSGQALGLHVRNEDPAVTSVQKEMRSRIWWSIYSLETMLCTITGRPSAAVEHQCSVPLPLPLAAEELDESTITSLLEERLRNMRKDSLSRVDATAKLAPIRRYSSNAWPQANEPDEPTNCGTYLNNLVTVNMICTAALADLYSATTVNKSWETIQRNVTHLLGRLDAWASSLPPGLDFLSPKAAVKEEFGQERMVLAYNYYSTRILITRPCLCRIDRHVPSQSHGSDGFNKRMSEACVEAAASIAGLLPDGADQVGIQAYHVTPWWSMVHFLMQAVTTLLLDIFSVTTQISPGRHERMTCLKRILRCLRVMSSANALAGRAYNIAFNILQILAAKTDAAAAPFDPLPNPMPFHHPQHPPPTQTSTSTPPSNNWPQTSTSRPGPRAPRPSGPRTPIRGP